MSEASDNSVDSVFVPLTDEQLRAIGLVCHHWSILQTCLERLIWCFCKLSMETGRLVTTQINDLTIIDITRTLCGHFLTGTPRQEALDMIGEYDSLRIERNKVVHNTWGGSEQGEFAVGFKPTAKGEFKPNTSYWHAVDIEHLAGDIENLTVRLVNFISAHVGWHA